MANTRATIRHPRGWDRVVEQVNAAADPVTFHNYILDLQCKIVAAEYGALWARGEGNEPTLVSAWPPKLAQMPPDSRVMKILSDSAKSGFEKEISHLLKVELEPAEPHQGLGPHAFITVMRVAGQVAAVSTVVAHCSDAQVIQSTAPLREVAAGLYEGFVSRQEAAARAQDAQRVRKAMALLAVTQEAEGFKGSCLHLVTELAQQLKCSRVSLGWVKGKMVKLVAMSDTEQLRRHSEQVALTELAMAECLDQQQPLVCPLPPNAEPLLVQAVVYAHRRLAGLTPGRQVLSIPLRQGEEWLGVITLERPDQPFDGVEIQQLQLISDVLSPQLLDRKRGDRWLLVHAWQSLEKASGYLIGPRHVAWKLLAAGLLLGLVLAFNVTRPYQVSANCLLQARAKRLVPAPFEGTLQKVLVDPGVEVQAGDLLARLDTTDLELELLDASKSLKLAELERQQALAQGKQSEALQAAAKVEQISARLDLLHYRIERAELRSPINGRILLGDWHDRVGGVVRQGETMFEIAPLDDLFVQVLVSEDRINHVRVDQRGALATRSEPGHSIQFVVQQIVPAATPADNENVFEVRGRLTQPPTGLRPGMEGIARIETDPHTLAWIYSHRVVNAVRLWLWK